MVISTPDLNEIGHSIIQQCRNYRKSGRN